MDIIERRFTKSKVNWSETTHEPQTTQILVYHLDNDETITESVEINDEEIAHEVLRERIEIRLLNRDFDEKESDSTKEMTVEVPEETRLKDEEPSLNHGEGLSDMKEALQKIQKELNNIQLRLAVLEAKQTIQPPTEPYEPYKPWTDPYKPFSPSVPPYPWITWYNDRHSVTDCPQRWPGYETSWSTNDTMNAKKWDVKLSMKK